MLRFTCSNRLRAVVAIAALALAGPSFADVVENVPFVPPANGVYVIPTVCMPPLCIENIAIGNFVTTSSKIVGGNQLTQSNVTFTGDAFQDNMGSPGMFLGPVSMTGTADITFFDKMELSQLGTFNTQLTSLNLDGTFTLPGLGSHDVGAMLNPMQSSDGKTTITQIGSNLWNVSGNLDVWAELSVNDGPFVPGMEPRMATLTSAVPEPSLYWIIAGVAGIMFVLRRARRRSSLFAPSA